MKPLPSKNKDLTKQDIYNLLFRLEQYTDRIARTAQKFNTEIRYLMGDSYINGSKTKKNKNL